MATRKPTGMDGFVVRRNARSVGGVHQGSLNRMGTASDIARRSAKRPSQTTLGRGSVQRPVATPITQPSQAPTGISRRDIDESLNSIDDEAVEPPKRRKFLGLFGRKKKPAKKPLTRRQKIVKWIIWLLVIVIIGVGAYVGIKAMMNLGSIAQGNLLGIFQNKPLKTDANGRSNILIYGTSGTFDDKNHEGADLTDTLIVLSVDQKEKNAYMVSIPRDLWVDYEAACAAGYEGKINALYMCHSDNGENEAAGAKALQKTIGNVTGLDFQYYMHVNWAVLTEGVAAVGGVDVNVEGNGSCYGYGVADGGVVDYNMKVSLEPGVQHMNSDTALRFSRARGAAGGCGLASGDFDRQRNQQKVITALREKAVSAGTVTNVGAVTSLMDALGRNLNTDFQTSEIRTLMSLAGEIKTDQIKSIDLIEDEKPLLTTGNVSGQSIVRPVAGIMDYSEIRALIKKTLVKSSQGAEATEEANIVLLNGSGVTGYAAAQDARLAELGLTVSLIDNAPQGTYRPVEIYQVTDGNPATKKKLEKTYGTTATQSTPPVAVDGTTDFVVIFGEASSQNVQ